MFPPMDGYDMRKPSGNCLTPFLYIPSTVKHSHVKQHTVRIGPQHHRNKDLEEDEIDKVKGLFAAPNHMDNESYWAFTYMKQ